MNTTSHSHDFTFLADSETLAATIDFNATQDKPAILSLHGGGPSGRHRVAWLSKFLAEHGHSVLRFDHTGQGDSSGDLKQSSLKKRRDEALAAMEFMQPDDGYTIIGTSMGGAVALELLPHLNIKNLILFCPAAYAVRAFDVPFGDGFTEIIRTPDSYRDAEIFDYLKNFTGNLVFIIGDNDEIIPAGVTDMYRAAATSCARAEFIILKDAPHTLHKWLTDKPEQQQMIVEKILAITK